MPFRIFCGVLGLVLCANALTVYFILHSIRAATFTTLACALFFQVAYFGSVLLLVWRSGNSGRAGQKARHCGSCGEVRHESSDHNKKGEE
ncbi:exopolysaccharide production repressor protein [Mesorhizobium sp. WSM2239]|uniref:Exopolysaccharide production repressor protein n=2 Tax=unclassified Mesorhizobium TaxID=325217 RepID=A0AAU8D6S0_9HYPH